MTLREVSLSVFTASCQKGRLMSRLRSVSPSTGH
jgi:hypothetical protein